MKRIFSLVFLLSFLGSLGQGFPLKKSYRLSSVAAPAGNFVANAIIPLAYDDYFVNNPVNPTAEYYVSGNNTTNWFPGGAGMNYDTTEVVGIFPQQYQAIPKHIKIYWYGNTQVTTPSPVYLRRKSDKRWFHIGNIDDIFPAGIIDINVSDSVTTPFVADRVKVKGGAQWNEWPRLGTGDVYGAKFEVWGDYYNIPYPYFPNSVYLKDLVGTNMFVWDLTEQPGVPYTGARAPLKAARFQEMGIKLGRVYTTWQDFEAQQGVASLGWSYQGWAYDSLFSIMKDIGIEPLLTIMGMPQYMAQSWANAHGGIWQTYQYWSTVFAQDSNNREDPFVYDDVSKLAYNVGARWGDNASIDTNTLWDFYDHPESWVPDDHRKVGLGTVKWYEFGNENDAFWFSPVIPAGRANYNDGRKIAAKASAALDGHMGAMGPYRGLKTACPRCELVLPGFAIHSSDAMRGIYEWTVENRGWLDSAHTRPNYPFKISNFHHYSTDIATNGQYGGVTTALPPESSKVGKVAREFTKFKNVFNQGGEVWQTEWGLDYHPQSLYQGPPYGPYTSREVIGAWALRTMFWYAANGINRTTWFKAFDDNPFDPVQYRTMSLLDSNRTGYNRRIIGDYYVQLKKWGAENFKFDSLIRGWIDPGHTSDSVIVMKWKDSTGRIMFTGNTVETQKDTTKYKFVYGMGFDNIATVTFAERIYDYTITLPSSDCWIKIHDFVPESSTMATTAAMHIIGGTYNWRLGMRPRILEIVSPP